MGTKIACRSIIEALAPPPLEAERVRWSGQASAETLNQIAKAAERGYPRVAARLAEQGGEPDLASRLRALSKTRPRRKQVRAIYEAGVQDEPPATLPAFQHAVRSLQAHLAPIESGPAGSPADRATTLWEDAKRRSAKKSAAGRIGFALAVQHAQATVDAACASSPRTVHKTTRGATFADLVTYVRAQGPA